ncbi:metal-dependent hydrolase [Desulfothermus okinawensis JCM 13304]
MPGYKVHLAGGMALTGACVAAGIYKGWFDFNVLEITSILFIGSLGALFPDVDTDSKGQNIFYFLLASLDLALMIKKYYKWAAILGFMAMLPPLGKHRGWTHTLWAMVLVPSPMLVLPLIFYKIPLERLLPFYLAAVTGYFSHLLLDRKFL